MCIPRYHPFPPTGGHQSYDVSSLSFRLSFYVGSFPLTYKECFLKTKTKNLLYPIFPFLQSLVYSNFLARARCANKLSSLAASCSLLLRSCYSVQSGFCPSRSNETTLAKVKNVLHFARYNGELLVPIALDLLTAAVFHSSFSETLPVVHATSSLLRLIGLSLSIS